MRSDRLLTLSERWFRLLLRLYPADFQDENGDSLVEAYRDEAREAIHHGVLRLARVWWAAFRDSLKSGLTERRRPSVSWRRGGDWGRDLGLVGRRLRQTPMFFAAVLGTLTVGLGAFAVVYTAVDKILIEPLPYEDPDDLYLVWRDDTAYSDGDRNQLRGPDVVELQQAGGVIEDAAAWRIGLATLSDSPETNPSELTSMEVSENLFDLLGVVPALGRGFSPGEVGPDPPPVVVLSDALWRRLGGGAAILGAEVELGATRCTVIGVMPPDFRLAGESWWAGSPRSVDLFRRLGAHLADPDAGDFTGLIRARQGTSPEAVAAEVGRVGRLLDERDNQNRGRRYYPVGLQTALVAPIRPALIALGFAAVFLLLVLTVNLASLLLARAAGREREFAVSRALGANGLAVVGAIVIEGGLLGLAGGLLGAIAGIWGTRLLVTLAPLDLPRLEDIALDWGIAVAVIAVGVFLSLLAAAVPAAWASRASLAGLHGRSALGGGARSSRLRAGLIVAQVALSLVLLSAGGLVVRSFERLLAVDPGFRSEGVLTFHLLMSPQIFGYPETADAFAFQDRVAASLRALPGVTAVGATSALPLRSSASSTRIWIPGAPGNTGDVERDAPLVNTIIVGEGYVETMGMRLLDGRDFDENHRDDLREALIDRSLAERFFPAGSPLGATIPFGPPGGFLTIVGVVEQVRLYDLHQDGRGQVFIRQDDWGPYGQPYFVVARTEREPRSLIPEVRAAIGRIDPRVPLSRVRTMDEIVADARGRERISAVLIAGFALGALVLAAMGLFGVVSGSVARRRGELAVRLALGATHGRVVGLAVGEGARIVVLGLLLGIPGTYVSGQAIRGILYGISPFDAPTLVAVALGLTVVALLPCYLAARRVMAIQPAVLLRGN